MDYMNNRNYEPGISLFICVILISLLLMFCTGVWKTTSYLVDFTLQKQIYVQNRYIIEGIMRLVIKWTISSWIDLHKALQYQNQITYSFYHLPTSIEHLKDYRSYIIIQRNLATDMLYIEVVLSKEQDTILKAHCNLMRSEVFSTSNYYFRVCNWHIGT